MTDLQATKYGSLPLANPHSVGGGEDVSNVWTLSVDCRAMSGIQWGHVPDETAWLEPGVVQTAVFPTQQGSHPIGEIRIIHENVEVKVVGSLTGRAGELTMDQLRAALVDANYRDVLVQWLART